MTARFDPFPMTLGIVVDCLVADSDLTHFRMVAAPRASDNRRMPESVLVELENRDSLGAAEGDSQRQVFSAKPAGDIGRLARARRIPFRGRFGDDSVESFDVIFWHGNPFLPDGERLRSDALGVSGWLCLNALVAACAAPFAYELARLAAGVLYAAPAPRLFLMGRFFALRLSRCVPVLGMADCGTRKGACRRQAWPPTTCERAHADKADAGLGHTSPRPSCP